MSKKRKFWAQADPYTTILVYVADDIEAGDIVRITRNSPDSYMGDVGQHEVGDVFEFRNRTFKVLEFDIMRQCYTCKVLPKPKVAK